MSVCMVYITAKDKEEAERLGNILIEAKLAACINIIEKIESMFFWQDKIQQEAETVLLAKTRVALVGQLTEKVKQSHSYDCPCVVALPIIDGNPEFIDWIGEETAP